LAVLLLKMMLTDAWRKVHDFWYRKALGVAKLRLPNVTTLLILAVQRALPFPSSRMVISSVLVVGSDVLLHPE
jgi:hypothetical protein